MVEDVDEPRTAMRVAQGARASSATHRWLDTPWAVVAVMAAAILTRFFMAAQWSLWQDEETSLYFSQNLARSFAAHSPLFFVVLRGLFEVTGVSVAAGRMLTAGLGVLSIALGYVVIRRLLGRPMAVLTAALIVLSLGHLFWSQSIRYYILLFVFQIGSIYFFIDGFERNRPRELVLASVCLFLAISCHLSAALLFLVFIAYLVWTIAARDGGPGYGVRGLVVFAVPFVAASVFLLLRSMSFRNSLSSLVLIGSGPLLSPPIGLLARFGINFGPAVVLLSLPAPFIGRGIVPGRILRFLTCLAFVPMLEVIVIRQLRLFWPLWYQGFIGLIGVAALAAITLHSLVRRRHLLMYRMALAGVLATSLPLIGSYYTTMYGDRPRHREAVQFVQAAIRASGGPTAPPIYASSPGVVAFYLGYEPSVTMTQSQVKRVSIDVPEPRERDEWFVLEREMSSPPLQQWLLKECTLAASFAAHTGPKDRTVFVHRCQR